MPGAAVGAPSVRHARSPAVCYSLLQRTGLLHLWTERPRSLLSKLVAILRLDVRSVDYIKVGIPSPYLVEFLMF